MASPTHTWRTIGRLLSVILVGSLGAQVFTLAAFAFYVTFKRIMQALGEDFELFPVEFYYLIGLEILLVAGVSLYYYFKGEFEEEHPLFADRRIRSVRRRAKVKGEKNAI